MGTILRTAEALGVLHIALVGACCDLYSPKVLRGSMGAVFRLGVELTGYSFPWDRAFEINMEIRLGAFTEPHKALLGIYYK